MVRAAIWKAEVTEGDSQVAEATITDWYKTVYEPSYAAGEPTVEPAKEE